MKDLIAKYLQDGTLESQGQFTISPQKALEKFGRSAFPRKTAWLTKLLQAVAQASQGPEMSVVSQPRQLSITLKGKSFFQDAGTLMQDVLNLEKRGFGDPLIDGLRYLASTYPQSLDLLSVVGQDCKIARLTDEGVEFFEMEWPKASWLLEIQVTGEVDLGTEAEAKDELVLSAGFLGFPVSFNGKKLQGAWAGSGSGHVPGHGGTPLVRLAKKFDQEQRTFSGQVLGQRPATKETEIAYSVQPSRQGAITLNWVDQGVVLKRETIAIEQSQDVQLMLPFQKERADLGGFNFEPTFQSKQLLDKCTPLVTNLLLTKKTPSGGGGLPRSVRQWKFLLRPLVSILWFLNYGYLMLVACFMVLGFHDFLVQGWRAGLSYLLATGLMLSPTLALMWLKTWLDEPVTAGDNTPSLQPQSPEQVAVTPLSELEWHST